MEIQKYKICENEDSLCLSMSVHVYLSQIQKLPLVSASVSLCLHAPCHKQKGLELLESFL